MKKKTIEIAAAGLVMLGCLTAKGETESVNGVTWTYSLDENAGATIESATCKTNGDVTIPETLGGKPVRHVKHHVFLGHANPTSVKIPAGVTHISDDAFKGCNLKELVVAKGNRRYFAEDGCLCDRKTGKKIRLVEK